MRAVHAIWEMERSGGGTSVAVAGLTDALEQIGCPVTLLLGAGNVSGEQVMPRLARSLPIRTVRFGRRTVAIPGLAAAAHRAFSGAGPCVVHSHGLWTLMGVSIAHLARRSGLPLVVSPHGMLEPPALALRRWRKRVALLLGQRAVLDAADLLVATSSTEAENLRRLGFSAPIAVVPHGVQLSARPTEHAEATVHRALFVGRVHPIKGLPTLVEAWSRIRPRNWRCVIAGPSDAGHRAVLERQIDSQGLHGDFEFVGTLDASHKDRLYRTSDLFVLPSLSENFGIVVAEALSYGLPILATRGTPWREVAARGAGWWVDPTVDGLEQGLRAAFATTAEERAAIGRAGRQLAADELQWPVIGRRMAACYEWLFERTDPAPDCIVRS